jgi:hypothetical protein
MNASGYNRSRGSLRYDMSYYVWAYRTNAAVTTARHFANLDFRRGYNRAIRWICA